MSAYAVLYYSVIGCGIAAVPFYYSARSLRREREVRAIIVYLVGVAYLLAVFRAAGIDMENYLRMYEVDPSESPDLGYRALMVIFRHLDLPFFCILATGSIISLYAIRRLARFYRVDFSLLLLVWFAHIALARDLSQFRVGFAMAVCLIAVTASSRWLRYLLYLAGLSLHYSALAFVLSFEAVIRIAGVKDPRLRILWLLLLGGAMLAVGQAVSYLVFLDPRIELYLNWEREGYGLPGLSLSSLAFHLALFGLAWHRRDDLLQQPRLRPVFYLQFLGVVTLVSFSSVAILSGRLSNVILSLYPILLICALRSLDVKLGGRAAGKLASGILLLIVLGVLIARPSSFRIVDSIAF